MDEFDYSKQAVENIAFYNYLQITIPMRAKTPCKKLQTKTPCNKVIASTNNLKQYFKF